MSRRVGHSPICAQSNERASLIVTAINAKDVNAAVVGLLGAALYNPVWTSSVKSPGDFGIALAGFVLLTVWRAPPLLLVVFVSALGGIALALVKT